MTLVSGTTIGDAIANVINGLNPMSGANLAILKSYWEPMAQAIMAQGIGGFTSYNIVTVACQHNVQASVAHGMPSAPTLAIVLGASGGFSVAGTPVLADLGSGNIGVTARYGFAPNSQVASRARGSALVLTTNTWADVATLSLAPGKYQLSGCVVYDSDGAPTGVTDNVGGITTTSGNSSAGFSNGLNGTENNQTPTTNCWVYCVIPPYFVAPTTTTSYFLKALSLFSGGTSNAFGTLQALQIDVDPATSSTLTLMLLKQ